MMDFTTCALIGAIERLFIESRSDDGSLIIHPGDQAYEGLVEVLRDARMAVGMGKSQIIEMGNLRLSDKG